MKYQVLLSKDSLAMANIKKMIAFHLAMQMLEQYLFLEKLFKIIFMYLR
jgi:hypothetical protein